MGAAWHRECTRGKLARTLPLARRRLLLARLQDVTVCPVVTLTAVQAGDLWMPSRSVADEAFWTTQSPLTARQARACGHRGAVWTTERGTRSRLAGLGFPPMQEEPWRPLPSAPAKPTSPRCPTN